MGVVEEEADETIYWTELLAEAGIIERERLSSLTKETEEILSMVVASSKTLKKGRPR
jgi:four helix bundle protein